MNDDFYYTSPFAEPYAHDLRPLQDDLTVLSNPHKGWYFHYIDNGLKFPCYRNTIKEGDDLRCVPGINHMYLRFDWNDIEETEGVFNWKPIDDIIEEWGSKGYHVSMRLCTFEANRPMIPYATPKWVFDKGAKFTRNDFETPWWMVRLGFGKEGEKAYNLEPDYGDPIYLEALSRFMAEYGRKYNGHPLVDFVDVGTFGTFGEGHTGTGSQKKYPYEVLKKHIDLHLKNFPDTFVLVNDDMLRHAAYLNPEDTYRLANYCAAHHMGMRDDSVYVPTYCQIHGENMLAIPTGFDLFREMGPIDLENGHQWSLQTAGFFDGGFREIAALQRTHATYAGFHGDAYEWYKGDAGYHNYVANHLGYWYFPESYTLPEVNVGLNVRMKLCISNRGFAPAYHRYEFRITARNEQGEQFLLNENGADNRRWKDGETAKEVLLLNTSALAPGKYDLCLGLFYGQRAIQLGLKQEQKTDNGFYILGGFEVLPE